MIEDVEERQLSLLSSHPLLNIIDYQHIDGLIEIDEVVGGIMQNRTGILHLEQARTDIEHTLIENSLTGGFIRESIVGIGLNINETGWPEDLPNPVSLRELTGKTFDIRQELPRVQKEIRRRFGLLASPDGRKSLQEEFGKYMFRLREEPK